MKETFSGKFPQKLYDGDQSLGRDDTYFGNDLDPRLHSAYDMSLYTQAPNEQYRHLNSQLYVDASHLQLEEDMDRQYKHAPHLAPTKTLIPINHHFMTDINPTFVNPKQYEAIMRRRMKKMKQQKVYGLSRMRVKKKYKYETRSRHAKNRKRAKDGKFLSAPDQQSSKTESTVLRPQDEEGEEEEKKPCCADDEEEQIPMKKQKAEKNAKIKLEMDQSEHFSINSDELLGNFTNLSKRVSRRDNLDQPSLEKGPSLRKNDSLFEPRR